MKIEGFPYVANIFGQDRQPIDDADGYVRLAHGEQYFIQLKNEDDRRALINVTADGVKVGEWVIPAHFDGSTLIERPTSSQKRLTFFSAGSEEAQAALLDNVSEDLLGVVKFSFVREAPPRPVFRLGIAPDYGAMRGGGGTRGLGAGGTGLSGSSNQTFGQTTFREEPGFEPVVLSVRLAHDPERKLSLDVQPLEGHRVRETPVPPPVGGNPTLGGGKATSAPQVS